MPHCAARAAKLLETPDLKHVTVKAEDVRGYLGARRLTPEHVAAEDGAGVVNGLAYTEAGGDMLRIECAVLDGTGKLELTGSLGDVMKESAHAALSLHPQHRIRGAQSLRISHGRRTYTSTYRRAHPRRTVPPPALP